MKNRILLCSVLALTTWGGQIYAQQNTLPTSGRVGIGTTAPTSRLDVNGSVKIDSALVVKDSVRINKNLRVDQDVRFFGLTKLNETKVLMDFTVQGLSKFNGELKANSDFIAQGLAKFNGDVKMTTLEEISNLSNKYIVFANENGLLKKVPFDSVIAKGINQYFPHGEIQFGFCDLALPGGQSYSTNPYWRSAPYKLIVPCPEVKVGIGTENPVTKLDVRGDVFASKICLNGDPNAMGFKLFHLKAFDNNSPSYANTILFLVENKERKLFQINNNGTVRAREIKVNLETSWPDYVFAPSYQLTPLKEVESYILQNGHLPNVPSATDVEADGVNLGEMNKILLEKVEELTLHLIEQQKLMELQNQRISELEKNN